jgi:class 3 adenylate cyclase
MTAIAACRTCGTEPLENARFCHGCGSPVVGVDTHAEFKQVTVLFADVVRSMDVATAVGIERFREIMTELVTITTAVVKRYGGTVDKFTGDGIMTVFGAPVALEDHAIRACLAALGVQEEAKRLAIEIRERDGVDLQLRVGLNSGEVIAGEIGSGALGYTAVGEQVGMAQRMESVAPPGGVMLSASTARLVEGAAALGKPESVRIKGAEEPVPAQRLLGMGNELLSDVLSRFWSVGAGKCPPSRACWTAQPMAMVLWLRWWVHPASARAVWCVRWRQSLLGAVWRCSAPSANRTPPTLPSMSWRGCCGRPPVCVAWMPRPLVTECARECRMQTLRMYCFSMTCWASPIPTLLFRLSIQMRGGGG